MATKTETSPPSSTTTTTTTTTLAMTTTTTNPNRTRITTTTTRTQVIASTEELLLRNQQQQQQLEQNLVPYTHSSLQHDHHPSESSSSQDDHDEDNDTLDDHLSVLAEDDYVSSSDLEFHHISSQQLDHQAPLKVPSTTVLAITTHPSALTKKDDSVTCPEVSPPYQLEHPSVGDGGHGEKNSSRIDGGKYNGGSNGGSNGGGPFTAAAATIHLNDQKTTFSQRLRRLDLFKHHFKSQLIPCMSMTSILLTISALIIIWVMVTLPYQDVTTKPFVNLMTLRASILARYVAMKGFARFHVTNNFTSIYSPASTYSSYYYYKNLLNVSMMNLTQILPSDFQHEFLNYTRDSNIPFQYPIVQLWDQVLIGPTIYQRLGFNATTNQTRVITYLNNTAYRIAKRTYASPEYSQLFLSYESLFNSFIGNLTQYCTRIEDTARASYIVTICVISFCFLVVIPVMILVLMFIIKRDSQNEKLLNHTSQHLLKETLLDPTLRNAFKLYCKEKGLESTMNILEKVMSYKEHCKVSHSIQMKLFELTHDYVKQYKNSNNSFSGGNNFGGTSFGTSFSGGGGGGGGGGLGKNSPPLNNSSQLFDRKALVLFNISNEANKKIIHQELIKSQLCFEIIDELREDTNVKQLSLGANLVRIIDEMTKLYDQYNNRKDLLEEMDLLPPHLMDALEKELSDSLALTHLNFKSSYLQRICSPPHLLQQQQEEEGLNDANSGTTGGSDEFMKVEIPNSEMMMVLDSPSQQV
ncbi:hypothetical protein FDP41_010371 [Naegleria fowleri]|uniref:RGS domain-containing protein n=1 Tax=Naegleria fowleri TaxID=5763 RepID=A0A6A5C6D0_NAEFO|nr:uncharacterized protein FDP41_010371 [Naegleria fowleri]KAF0983306.1 hypothetical protein FDP41_010371 [Naegleria fowleri]